MVRYRGGIVASTPEPKCDIAAQIGAMLDHRHPKDTVFVARGNEDALPARLPKNVKVVRSTGGTMITTNAGKAARFASGMTDSGVARALGNPASKPAAVKAGTAARVIQAQDRAGCVVMEMVAAPEQMKKATKATAKQIPSGGRVVVTTAPMAQARRGTLRGKGL